MEKWKQFWTDVAKGIEAKYERGNPGKWQEYQMEEFLIHMSSELEPKFIDDADLHYKCGGAYNNHKIPYYKLSASSFRRIFIREDSLGHITTRNAFAIYLGYQSAEDYIHRKNVNAYFQTGKERIESDALCHSNPGKYNREPVPVILELQVADFEKEDKNDEWMVYEIAFLWCGKEPPGIQAHFYLMTREIEHIKRDLHHAVENGLLQARTEVAQNGLTRYIRREALEEYIKKYGLDRPDFLKKELR